MGATLEEIADDARILPARRKHRHPLTDTAKMIGSALRDKDASFNLEALPDARLIFHHTNRVMFYSMQLIRYVHPRDSNLYSATIWGSFFHDIGKVEIPNNILLKPSGLEEDEWKLIKNHPEIGYNMLEGYGSERSEAIRSAVRYHHERWDGSGYPLGLKGEEIPKSARIVAVADSFDAMTSRRPWKKRQKGSLESVDEIRHLAGTYYDPDIARFADCLAKSYSLVRRINFN